MPVFSRVSNFFRRSQLNRDIQEEQQSHLEMRVEDLIDSGMTTEQGRRAAMLKFGNPVAMKERVEAADAARCLGNPWRDVRYTLRQLRKSAGIHLRGSADGGARRRRKHGNLQLFHEKTILSNGQNILT
jgi:hypothetical protein